MVESSGLVEPLQPPLRLRAVVERGGGCGGRFVESLQRGPRTDKRINPIRIQHRTLHARSLRRRTKPAQTDAHDCPPLAVPGCSHAGPPRRRHLRAVGRRCAVVGKPRNLSRRHLSLTVEDRLRAPGSGGLCPEFVPSLRQLGAPSDAGTPLPRQRWILSHAARPGPPDRRAVTARGPAQLAELQPTQTGRHPSPLSCDRPRRARNPASLGGPASSTPNR